MQLARPQPGKSYVDTLVKARTWLPQGKDLDLLLLAGCSCLLTLVYHPVTTGFSATSLSSYSALESFVHLSETTLSSESQVRSIVLWHGEQRREEL